MAVTGAAALLAWAAAKLSVDFPPSFPDQATSKARQVSWRELIEANPWVTEDVFRLAVSKIRFTHPGPFVPPPALFLDFCQAAADDLQRDARRRHRQLPAPPPPTDDERRAEEDRAEAAKLKARLSLPEKLRKRVKR
jgi:hypothetical protein